MKNLALILPLLALAVAPARAANDALTCVWVPREHDGQRSAFNVEAWSCVDSTNGTLSSSLSWLKPDDDGGAFILTMPQRMIAFNVISNSGESIWLRHCPGATGPMRVQTGDRVDFHGCGFTLSASVVDQTSGIGLAILRDASSEQERLVFPAPDAKADYVVFSDTTLCFTAASAGEGSPTSYFFLNVSGPFADSATNAPAASETHAENAENAEN